MGTIQEALRELRNQRLDEEKQRKSNRSKKVIKESLEEDNKEEVVECDKTNTTLEEGSLYNKIKALAGKGKDLKDESLNDDDEEDLDNSLNESESFVDEDGDIENPNFSLVDFYNESCNKKNLDEEKVEEAVDSKLVDADGDVEDPNFNLASFANESLKEAKDGDNEKLTYKNVQKLPEFKNISQKAINALIKSAKKNNDLYSIQDFKDYLDDNYGKVGVAILAGPDLAATDFVDLVKGDKKLEDVIIKIAKIIDWIDDNGYYVDGSAQGINGHKPSTEELIKEYVRYSLQDKDSLKYSFDILEKAYFDNNYSEVSKVSLKNNK